jgi:hypothetical protein
MSCKAQTAIDIVGRLTAERRHVLVQATGSLSVVSCKSALLPMPFGLKPATMLSQTRGTAMQSFCLPRAGFNEHAYATLYPQRFIAGEPR